MALKTPPDRYDPPSRCERERYAMITQELVPYETGPLPDKLVAGLRQ
jgi:hypothetical protein